MDRLLRKNTQKTRKKQLKTKSIQQNSMSINVYASCVRKRSHC